MNMIPFYNSGFYYMGKNRTETDILDSPLLTKSANKYRNFTLTFTSKSRYWNPLFKQLSFHSLMTSQSQSYAPFANQANFQHVKLKEKGQVF